VKKQTRLLGFVIGLVVVLVAAVMVLLGPAARGRDVTLEQDAQLHTAAQGGAASGSANQMPLSSAVRSSGAPITDELPVGSVGTASTDEAGFVSGANQGLSSPPSAPAALNTDRERENAEEENDPLTPIDPSAPLKFGPPSVPASEIVEPSGNSSGSAALAAPDSAASLVFKRNSDLGSGAGSIINEPSHASLPNSVVLETWNWYAGISQNNGTSWTYYNPATLFPNSYAGYCCDQVAYYDQNHDITIWILQYSPNVTGTNGIRLAWAKGSAAVASASFCYTTFTPQQLGNPEGTNYDQPKFARSNNDYYLEITRYGAASGSVVIRFAASALTWPSCSGISYSYYVPGLFSPGFTQRAYDTMYFAAHVDNNTLRVFTWPESSGSITTHDITHTAYPQNYPYSCPRTGGSGTSDWCQRRSFGGGWAHSDRIFTGWIAGGVLNFMWDASQGTGGFGTFPYPYVHVARINASTYALVNEPIMWSSSTAFAYSAAALNDRLDVAGMVMYGGGSLYESCAAFVWDHYTSAPAPWTLYAVRASNSDPYDTLSGDYLTARRNGMYGYTWSGSCYALVGGSANSNVHTYYAWFGREEDFPRVLLPLILKNH
jgi:hypothetical protein